MPPSVRRRRRHSKGGRRPLQRPPLLDRVDQCETARSWASFGSLAEPIRWFPTSTSQDSTATTSRSSAGSSTRVGRTPRRYPGVVSRRTSYSLPPNREVGGLNPVPRDHLRVGRFQFVSICALLVR